MKKVKVFAPSTIVNVACGYEILGFAINKPGDEVIARPTDEPKALDELKHIEDDFERILANYEAFNEFLKQRN